jgi:hypothetical protein
MYITKFKLVVHGMQPSVDLNDSLYQAMLAHRVNKQNMHDDTVNIHEVRTVSPNPFIVNCY